MRSPRSGFCNRNAVPGGIERAGAGGVAELGLQALRALGYYGALVVMVRLLGKRLAGQTTTFDLIVMITLGVVLQTTALADGTANAFVFIVTILAAHRLVSAACARCDWLRHLMRGAPRPLVRGGTVLEDALSEERISREELLAGLRKLGFASPEDVELAVLEETGHVSAIARQKA
jgi:uncharacterized membrane protein YcaP (DUF421 family)